MSTSSEIFSDKDFNLDQKIGEDLSCYEDEVKRQALADSTQHQPDPSPENPQNPSALDLVPKNSSKIHSDPNNNNQKTKEDWQNYLKTLELSHDEEEILNDPSLLRFHKQRPQNLYQTAVQHKETGTKFFKTGDLQQAANAYELGIKKCIIALFDDIFIWKIRDNEELETINFDNLSMEEKSLHLKLIELKCLLHSNLAMCYFKKVTDKAWIEQCSMATAELSLDSEQRSKLTANQDLDRKFKEIVITNTSKCIEKLEPIIKTFKDLLSSGYY